MELYIGGLAQGKLDFVLNKTTHLQSPIICDGLAASEEDLYQADIINHLHLYIQKKLQEGEDVDSLPHKLLLRNPYVTIICNEVGSGIVPMEKSDRIYHEKVGRICHEIAKRSQKVVHIQCGIGTTLKEKNNTILCSFIRHGKTIGNLSKRYIGSTDQPLCEEGISELNLYHSQNAYPVGQRLYVSPMTRCIQTANLLYPNKQLLSCAYLKECDFGEFENKNYEELSDNPHYQEWVDSNGTLSFPNGENPNDFTLRCVQGFLACISNALDHLSTTAEDHTPSWINFIVHGGTIMSILSELSPTKADYFSFQIDNGQGYLCEYDIDQQKLTVLDTLF